MARRKLAISTWRKRNFACDAKGQPLPGALSLPTIRKMIDDDDMAGVRIGAKYFVYVDNNDEMVDSCPLVQRVMAG